MRYKTKEDIIENLKDAGCDEADIECFIREFLKGNEKLGVKILREHRDDLLSSLHAEQAKIDCLDYFLYRLEKKEVEIEENM